MRRPLRPRLHLSITLTASLLAVACGDDSVAGTGGPSETDTDAEPTTDASTSDEPEPTTASGGTEGCAENLTDCDGLCIDTTSDRDHCGGCDVVCSVEEVCNEGACATSCGEGKSECDGTCVDTETDRAHCGACGEACDAGEVCSEGACGLSCGGDTPDQCGNGCFDLQSDPQHCGACDEPCALGASCSEGACGCADEQEICDDTCVDTQSDVNHCGDCDTPCGQGEICSEGACTTSCPDGQTACDGQCVDLLSDALNCNGCGEPCGDGEQCVAGACTPSCAEPLIACDDACVDPQSDPDYCGDCMTSCAGEGAVGVCLDGGCDLLCLEGRADCDDDYSTGCEIDITADNVNCGGCGVTCDGTCSAQGCIRHVFVSDAVSNGNLGGLDGADATCQAEADAAGLEGTYLAWLSTSSSEPADRFVQSAVPYVLPGGTVVADDWVDLTDGTLLAPINLNAAGEAPAAPVCNVQSVWTNAATDGTVFNTSFTCSNWTTGSGVGHFGRMSSTSVSWTNHTGAACNASVVCGAGQVVGARLYCFQQ